MNVPFKLTVFESSGSPLNKTIKLEDGKLKKVANGQFSEGHVQVVSCDGLASFKRHLEECEQHVAYSLGHPWRDGEWLDHSDIVTNATLANVGQSNSISRSKQFFRFAEGPALIMFDIDGGELTADEVWVSLCDVDPQLTSAGHMVVHSSSSHIHHESTGELLSGSSGYHIYCVVKNGTDIARYGEVFAKRCWLAGLGRIEISKAGSFLVRQLIDACVYSPERLIFEAPVELGTGLIQKKPEISVHDGGVLITETFLNLNEIEEMEYSRLVAEAKQEKEPLARQVKEKWLDEKSNEIATRTGCDWTIACQAAGHLLMSDTLSIWCTLLFDAFGLVTVEDVVSDPTRFDKQTMADPIEHGYNGGRNIAVFYWNDGNPRIHSYAHGGKVYTISKSCIYESVLRQAIKRAETDAGAHWTLEVLAAASNLYRENRQEFERLRALLKQKCSDARIVEWDKAVLKDAAEGESDKPSAAVNIVNYVNMVSETFHDGKGEGYITLDMDDHKETWALDSVGFSEWLEYYVYTEMGSVLTEITTKGVKAVLQGQAKHEGEEREVFVRCAPFGDGYLIDMTNDKWQVISVTPRGWQVWDESPVKFIRSKMSAALPMPTQGSIDEFWKHVNIPQEARTLVLAWMLDSLRSDTEFTILELTGEHGTAKSSTHTRIRQLTDPNKVPLRSAPSDVQDMFVSAGSNWQSSFENMSYLTDKMQDGLCTLATGGGFAARKLYTNTEESVIDVKRPCIINGISAVATRPDLIDRIIHLDLLPIGANISKGELDKKFGLALPAILAGFLDIFSQTLKHLPNVSIKKLPRMADYALLGQALHAALDDPRAFVDVYNANRTESMLSSLDASPVALAVWQFAKDNPQGWTGSTKTLKSILDTQLHDYDGWPKTPKGLGGALRRMGPALREVGVHIKTERKRDGYVLNIDYVSPPKVLESKFTKFTMFTPEAAS